MNRSCPPDGPRAARSLFARTARILAAAGLVLAVAPTRAEPALQVPLPFDPETRVERRITARPATIRFLVDDEYPPFAYPGRDGQIQGFNVDLARLICVELGATCTVQPRRWDLLLPGLSAGEGDAALAGHRIDATLRRDFAVSLPILRVPARFAGKRGAIAAGSSPADLAGKRIAVVGGSAHEAFLNAFYPSVVLIRFGSVEPAAEAMRRGQADLVFADAVSLSFWMNGSESLACCRFQGDAFTESHYFGEGAGIVLRKGDTALREAIDAALIRIARDGRYARLYLRHFPVPLY